MGKKYKNKTPKDTIKKLPDYFGSQEEMFEFLYTRLRDGWGVKIVGGKPVPEPDALRKKYGKHWYQITYSMRRKVRVRK